MREKRTLIVPEIADGERIDAALVRVLGLSRSAIVRLLDSGDITCDGKAVAKSLKVEKGQVIEVLMPDSSPKAAIPVTPVEGLDVVYNDEDIVVVNKPVGVAAHPSGSWTGPTVIGALIAAGYTITTSGPAERSGIVQRLDVGTSGLMMVAKSERAYLALKEAFRKREVHKIYHALVQGHLDPSTGTIDAPIDRHPRDDYKMAVIAGGKESITHYKVIEYHRGVSLVEIELETGRTHQIRVHFSALNHPLVGDFMYGADPNLAQSLEISRPWLHALALSFDHPITGIHLELSAPYPSDLQASLALLSDAVLP